MAATSDRMQIPEYVKRELSEVYLLMDHIAGRKDKTLDEALASKITGGRQITLDELCGVAWPPLEQDRGKVLALVLTAKDRLSRAAYPATGYSVAFTYLTLAEYVRRGGWGQRLFGRSTEPLILSRTARAPRRLQTRTVPAHRMPRLMAGRVRGRPLLGTTPPWCNSRETHFPVWRQRGNRPFTPLFGRSQFYCW